MGWRPAAVITLVLVGIALLRHRRAPGGQEDGRGYIPALQFTWLTPLYDPLVALALPEEKIKTSLIEQGQISRHDKVLDLGCGTATLTLMIKRRHPQAEVIGLDGDPKILEIARQKVAKEAVHIRFDQGLASALPYPDGYFHRVVSSLVFHHLTQDGKGKALKEVFRVLQNGGEVHIADFGPPQNRYARAAALLLRHFEQVADNLQGIIPGLMRRAGFEEVKETACFSTLFGTVSLYRGRKPR